MVFGVIDRHGIPDVFGEVSATKDGRQASKSASSGSRGGDPVQARILLKKGLKAF